MKEFKQAIPEGMQARVENGCVVYTPIEVCPFEIGDVIVFQGVGLYLFEGFDEFGHVYRTISYNTNSGYFQNRFDKEPGSEFFRKYTKATPEQEELFNQKCLENGVWFDHVNKKWVELKEGGVYNVDGLIEVFDKFTTCNKSLNFKCTLEKNGKLFELGYITGYHNIINISEATEEEKQKLFNALKEEGKQWNAEKNCVEDLMWAPEEFDRYVYYDAGRDKVSSTQHIDTSFDRHMVNIGNCFKTEAECEKYAEYMKECSKNYKQ